MIDLGSMFTKIEADTSGLNKAGSEIEAFATKAAGVLAAAFTVSAIAEQIKTVTMLTSRYDQMGVVMDVVGKNAGYSHQQMALYQQTLEKTGISMIAARETLTKMTQSEIDLSKSTELARVAQDAAKIGNINSSEAFTRMIQGIQSGEVEILRNIGLQVNFEAAYQRTASTLGKTTAELTNKERIMARSNDTLRAGALAHGVYAASLETVAGKLSSMPRILQNIQVKMGDAFQPAFLVILDKFKDSIDKFEKSLDSSTIKKWAEDLKTTTEKTIAFAEAINKLSEAANTPGMGQLAIVAAVLAKFGPQAAAATGAALTFANTMNKQGKEADELDKSLAKVKERNSELLRQNAELKGVTFIDPNKVKTEVEKVKDEIKSLEDKLLILKGRKWEWSSQDTPKKIAETTAEIKKLTDSLPDAKIRDAFKFSDLKVAFQEATRAAVEESEALKRIKAEIDKNGGSVTELTKKYKEHKDAIKKISDEIKNFNMSSGDKIRELQQSAMSPLSALKDIQKQAQESEEAATKAYKAAQGMSGATGKDDIQKRSDLYDEAIAQEKRYLDFSLKVNQDIQSSDQFSESQKKASSIRTIKIAEEEQRRINEIMNSQKAVEEKAGNSDAAKLNEINMKAIEAGEAKAVAMFGEIKTQAEGIATITIPNIGNAVGAAFDPARITAFIGIVKQWEDAAAEGLLSEEQKSKVEILAKNVAESYQKAMENQGEATKTFYQAVDKSLIEGNNSATEAAMENSKKLGKTVSEIEGVWTNVAKNSESAFIDSVNGMIGKVNELKRAASSVKFNTGNNDSSYSYDGMRTGGLVYHAQTGRYFPGYGGGDTIPIMGEAGEVMIRKESVKGAGLDTAEAFNTGNWRKVVSNLSSKLSLGGPVSPSFPRQHLSMGGVVNDVSTNQKSETIRKYYIHGEATPITVRSSEIDADRLFRQLEKKYKGRSK